MCRASRGDVRGRGLLVGVEIVKDRKSKTPGNREIAMINNRAFEKGLLTAYDGLRGNVFRIMPSLTLTKEQVDIGLRILEESIQDFEKGAIPEVQSLWQ